MPRKQPKWVAEVDAEARERMEDMMDRLEQAIGRKIRIYR